jgi:hypothetical protein
MGLSSLAGAMTLTNVFVQRGMLAPILIIVLFIVGVAIQAGRFWSEQSRTG